MVLSISWLWMSGLFASSVVLFHEVMKPRLPMYQMCLIPWSVPSLIATSEEWKMGVDVSVSMWNENFVDVDVYAIAFDLYDREDTTGRLYHVTHLHDEKQASAISKESSRSSPPTTDPSTALWEIGKRKDFLTSAKIYVNLNQSFFRFVFGNLRLLMDLWRKGSFRVPSSGVAHILTKPGFPFTVEIVCDNVIQIARVSGIKCELRQLASGWKNLTETTHNLRSFVIENKLADHNGLILSDI